MVKAQEFKEVRDTLLRENKFDAKKQYDERIAYANGVLDMYNETIKALKKAK